MEEILKKSPSQHSISLSDLTISKSLRCNEDYFYFYNFNFSAFFKTFSKVQFQPLKNAVVNIRNGKDVAKEDYSLSETNYFYLTVNNIKKEGFSFNEQIFLDDGKGEILSDIALRYGDLIITRSGTVGMCRMFNLDNEKIYIPSGYLIILSVDKSKYEPKFLEYFLSSTFGRRYFGVHASGKTQQNISQPDVLSIPIPVLDLEEQKRIIEAVDENIQSKIVNIERKIEFLQDAINDVFGKHGYSTKPRLKRDEEYLLKNKFSDISKTNWLSTRTYLCRFIEDELPLFLKENLKSQYIPFSKYVNKIRSGEYIPKQYYSSDETNFVYLRINNISSNELNLEEPIFLQDSVGEQYKDIAIKENDLILTRSGTVGKCIIFKNSQEDSRVFIPSHHLAIMQFNNFEEALFLKYYVQSSFGSDFFWAFSTGKSQKEITNWSIRKLPIPAIGKKNQHKIVFEIQQREEKSNKCKEEIKKLREEIDDMIYQSLKVVKNKRNV
jgi:type I restriction enzyme S subunit